MRYLNCNNNTIISLWRAFHCLWRIHNANRTQNMNKIHKKWKINKASGFFKCAEKETSFCRYYQKAANKFYRSPLSAEWQQEKKSRVCSRIATNVWVCFFCSRDESNVYYLFAIFIDRYLLVRWSRHVLKCSWPK